MAVIIKGVPPDLPPGVHKVLIRPVRNRKGFRILEGELVEVPPRRTKIQLEFDGEQAIEVFKVVDGGRVRIGHIVTDSTHELGMLLEAVGCEILGSTGGWSDHEHL